MAMQPYNLGPQDAAGYDTQFQAHSKHIANVTELYSMAGARVRTPENSGFTTTKDGTGDNTAALNGFLSLLATSGDPGFLPPGDYRTTAELVAPTGPLNLRGVFGRTCIRPNANTYHGLRIASGTRGGLAGSIIPTVVVEGLWVRGPTSPPPKNGKAGIVFDAATQFLGSQLLVEGFDIGFDQINNCYNGTWRDIYTSRNVGTVNCGYFARTGAQNGCDIDIFNAQLTGIETAMCFSGQGGGYRVFGASCGTTSTTPSDKYGIVTLGWDYAADAEAGGLGSMPFHAVHMEGWRGRYAYRAYGSVAFSVYSNGFNPSATDTYPPGIYKHTNAAGSVSVWFDNSVGPGAFNLAHVADIQGANDDFHLFEAGWSSNACTVGGVAKGRNWLKSLNLNSALYQSAPGYAKGLSLYTDGSAGGFPALALGRSRLKADTVNGLWYQGEDGVFEPFGRPFVETVGGANANVETWHCPGRFRMQSGAANTVTVRPDSAANLPVHTKVQVIQEGAGQTTIVAGPGVAVRATPGLKLRAQNGVAWLEKVAANAWIAYGDLSA